MNKSDEETRVVVKMSLLRRAQRMYVCTLYKTSLYESKVTPEERGTRLEILCSKISLKIRVKQRFDRKLVKETKKKYYSFDASIRSSGRMWINKKKRKKTREKERVGTS